nr:alpha/beta hydrolase [uncultured Dyadobacter sp.]
MFSNTAADIQLSGTLTRRLAEKTYPAVILISGSGPHDRNEEVNGGHKPFLVIADYLTRKGIAVLRFDDRGIYNSTGNFSQATSLDFCGDVESAVTYLKSRQDIDSSQIGLIGHSEGAMVASIVAARHKNIAFVVLLAAPGIRGDSLMLDQGRVIREAAGMSREDIQKTLNQAAGLYNIVLTSKDSSTLKTNLFNYANSLEISKDEIPAGMSGEQFVSQQVDVISSPWWQFFLKHDPSTTFHHVTCPVLALNDSKDWQVTPRRNLAAIKSALSIADNRDVTITELRNLNHFFQECETGSPEEYPNIKQTISPVALSELGNWMMDRLD